MSTIDAAPPDEMTPAGEGNWPALLWATFAAFGTYFSMYAFRKPFTAAGFADVTLWGYQLKTVFVTAQVLGYLTSKVAGIKFVSETPPRQRVRNIIGLIAIAEFSLFLFAISPLELKPFCLFLNGLPLGLVFGQVMGFLEGRRCTEALAAGLCASFIVADGATRSVGAWLLELKVPEHWMPCLAGLLFVPPLLLCVAVLSGTPAPSPRDVAARSKRVPMDGTDRLRFLVRYGWGLAPLILVYLLITVVRSMRGDFARELFLALGDPATPGAFAWSELWVGLVTLAVSGATALIVDNRRALQAALAACGAGAALLGVALLGLRLNLLPAFTFMVLIGIGLYLPYVAVHTTLFERLLGLTRERGNVGFMMYIADSVGYFGYVVFMLVRNAGAAGGDVLGMLQAACWITVGLSIVCLLQAHHYFTSHAAATSLPLEDRG